jgi:hypothetical protein
MIKKILSIVIALVLIFAFASCKKLVNEQTQVTAPIESATAAPQATPEAQAEIPNPIVEVDGAADFSDLGFIITPHQQAESVSYSIIGGKVAQINFTLDGKSYTYRGAVTTEDISGVYETFDPDPQSLDLEGPGFKVSLVVKTIDGGAKGALAEWSYEDVRYTFYTPDPTSFDDLTDILLPIVYNDLPFAACCG